MAANKRSGKARSGTGSFHRRGDGWECTLSVGAREERRRVYGYGRTQDDAHRDAQRQVAEAKERDAAAAQLDGRTLTTVGEFFDWWIRIHCVNRVENGLLAETTRLFYEAKVRLYIVPHLGAVPLADLSDMRVEAFLDALRREGASRHKIFTTLRAGPSVAVKRNRKLVPYNVAAGLEVPKPKRARREKVTLRDARALLAAAQGHPAEALYRLALNVPLRPGELTGAEWDQFQLKQQVFDVRQNLVRAHREWRLHDTKGRVRRDVPLPDSVVRLLRARRKAQAAERLAAGADWVATKAWVMDERGNWVVRPLDLVFTRLRGLRNPAGYPIYGDWLEADLAALCKTAGILVLTPHKLRHTAKTLLTAEGLDPHVVQQMGGWSDLATADLYTGVLRGKMREAVDRLATKLG